MRSGSWFLYFLITFWSINPLQELVAQDKITLKLKDVEFKELERIIKNNFNYRFYYLNENVNDIRLSFDGYFMSLEEIILKCEAQSNLKFEIDHYKKTIQLFLVEKRKVEGKVLVLGTEEPLIGALLRSKSNKYVGATTDIKGCFRIQLAAIDTFEITYLGHQKSQLIIDPTQSSSIVHLKPSTVDLDEVIVVAYGKKNQKKVLGSINKIVSKDLEKINSTSFEQKLQGRVSGLQIISSGGSTAAPARMLIRGINSISAGVNPLIIIDDTPISNEQNGLERSIFSNPQNPLSLINSNDITSIEILKDAASSTLYGSRASNGILLITTNSGYQGRDGFKFSYNVGLSKQLNTSEKLELANTETWFAIADRARNNSGESNFTPEVLTSLLPYSNPDGLSRNEALQTNIQWPDIIGRTGVTHDYQLSYQKYLDKVNFYISGNYRNEKGIIEGDNLDRYSLRANLDIRPYDKIKIQFRNNVSVSNKAKPISIAERVFSNDLKGGFSQAILSTLPWFPTESTSNPSGYWNPASGSNLAASNDTSLFFDKVNQRRYIGNLSLSYSLPINGLSVKSSLGLDLLENDNNQWISGILTSGNSINAEQNASSYLLNYNAFGNYNKVLGKHRFTVLSGIEAQRSAQELDLLIGETSNNSFTPINQTTTTFSQNEITKERYLFSYLGRVNYGLDEKIFFEINYRRDGTSAFAKENRWSNFASISSAWLLSESLFSKADFIDYLKLKASYGETGNQEVPNNLFTTNFRNDRRYGVRNVIDGGTSIQSLGARDLSWERSKSVDLGIEYSLFSDRHYGSITYFNQQIDDLLLEVPLPLSSTIDGSNPIVWENSGRISNRGFEIELGLNLFNANSFNWNLNFNYTHVNNKVEQLYLAEDKVGEGISSRSVTLTKSEGVLGAYYLASYAGIDSEKGVEMIHEIDQSILQATGETVKTGNLVPATRSNLRNNRFYHTNKSGSPTFFGGINSVIDYKRFTFDMLWSFIGGHYIFDYIYHLSHYPSQGDRNLQASLLSNSWDPNNTNVVHPQLRWDNSFEWDMEDGVWISRTTNYTNANFFSDKFLQRGDFIRLRNVRINYSFDVDQLRKLKLNSLDVYFSAQNLITFTKFKGLDPEVISINTEESINNLSPGYIRNVPLPNLTSFNIGVNMSF